MSDVETMVDTDTDDEHGFSSVHNKKFDVLYLPPLDNEELIVPAPMGLPTLLYAEASMVRPCRGLQHFTTLTTW
jgi:hypothetical protein